MLSYLCSGVARYCATLCSTIAILLLIACPGKTGPQRLTFIALSDTHIASGGDLSRLRQFLHTVRERGQFVLITGDICAHAPEYLENVREICRLAPLPVYVLPGNHDDNYSRSPEWWSGVFGPLARTFEAQGYQFLLNWSQDSLRCSQWLDSVLAVTPAGKRLVYAQHFPPGRFGDAAMPLLAGRANDFVLSLSGHTHTHNLDTLDCGLISLTLEACGMDSSREGLFYEIELMDGRLAAVRSFAFDSLALENPPDSPPALSLDDTSACVTVSGPLRLTGRALDDRGVAGVEYSLDNGPWLAASGADSFSLALEPGELGGGNHLLRARARDNTGNLSDFFASKALYVPEKPLEEGGFELCNGVDGYSGCRDITVRGHQPAVCAEGEDLECWTSGRKGQEEFSEFYISFDLGGLKTRPGAKVKSLELILFCCRQNSLSPGVGDDIYRVGLPGAEWNESITFESRPASPGWSAVDSGEVNAPQSGEWEEQLDGRQEVRPGTPVRIDLSAFMPQFERWLERPAENHGWVISPVRNNYNISFRCSECEVVTLRPRLRVRFN